MASRKRVEFGDWQTPDDLADQVVAHVLSSFGFIPQTIVEPTCGKGAFLVAMQRHAPKTNLVGYEINPQYVAIASSRLGKAGSQIHEANFFNVDWEQVVRSLPSPIVVIGNPPWVTSSELGVIGSDNHPRKQNFKGLSGLDALTGKSNFDVSEWMILRLIEALRGLDATIAMLCKSAVARNVIELSAMNQWQIKPGGIWRIDAARHFQASVDAVLFVCQMGTRTTSGSSTWPVHESLDARSIQSSLGIADGKLVADLEAFNRTRAISGPSHPEWRSGLKHDCAHIMELDWRDNQWMNGAGEIVDVEPRFRFPLLKSSDIANGRSVPTRAVIVPQRFLGEDTRALEQNAPKLWTYLEKHAKVLNGRKSSIYKNKYPFSIFGVGPYSFAPWKVAISGLYKRLRFCVVGPYEEQPVMLDDTCYFLPFAQEADAYRAARVLESDLARDYFRGRVFWDAKRPINKAILQNLDLDRLIQSVG